MPCFPGLRDLVVANYSSPEQPASPEGRVRRHCTKRAPPLRPAPAVLAAAALPLLSPPFCVRPALAMDVPTCSLYVVHVHA